MQHRKTLSTLDSRNTTYVERLLADFLKDESSVSEAWQQYFRTLTAGGMVALPPVELPPTRPPAVRPRAHIGRTTAPNGAPATPVSTSLELQHRADRLVRAYRFVGHLAAELDPLGLLKGQSSALLPATYGLGEADLDHVVCTRWAGGPDRQTLRQLLERLRNTYCRQVAVQFTHIEEAEIQDWLEQRMEHSENHTSLTVRQQVHILEHLTQAAVFEEFVRKKYLGAKTFSLEGSESVVPLLELAIDKAASEGVQEIVLGMPHRGRLNVLANIIGKPAREIFREFADERPEHYRGRGDVKYHLGFSGDWSCHSDKNVHLSLCFNPSHLEFVNPVAVGRMRAKQDRCSDFERQRGMVILVHGDAAFAGEGIVQETLNLSQLDAFATGGTLHVVVNNQLGFTTPPSEGRSATHPTDIARMLQIPIFHVNGAFPEAIAHVVDLAMDFRRRFQRDVVIDIYCYRRWGHNEADEPSFTQPMMYKAIENREPVHIAYRKQLVEQNRISAEQAEALADKQYQHLKSEHQRAQHLKESTADRSAALKGIWKDYRGGLEPDDDCPDTGVPVEQLRTLLHRLTATPEGFHRHPKLQRSVDQRLEMAEGNRPIDWSAAEALAIASLAVQGHPVRLSGQDSERGTFSQRHAVLHDTETGQRYRIFAHLDDDQAPVEVINSPLSEAGVLAFEYGYSLDYPEALVMWEAQYGDFWNAAQVFVDQFIASAEDKWQRLSGIVMLLPHGFEGQGPEHSSARLERFLNLAAEDNLQVVYPSTPAQLFHCLRRQILRPWRKPLVVLTPKSLLRHPQVVSSLADLSNGPFHRVLHDQREQPVKVRRLLLCSGKIYYDLLQARSKQQRDDTAIVRIEQFYPLPDSVLHDALKQYPTDIPVRWVQEEPQNMGAWPYWRLRFGDRLLDTFPWNVVARGQSASPATGSSAAHKREQNELVEQAFNQ